MIYGLSGSNETKTTFMNFDLESPSLNITMSPNGYSYGQGSNWANQNTDTQAFGPRFSGSYNYYYYMSNTNETFDRTTLQTKGSCQPTQTYKWGFSFLLLFICLILLGVWSIGTYILWLKAHFLLLAHGEPPVVGEYGAVIELGTTMTKEFDKHDESLEFLRERQIKGKIKHILNGGTITCDSPTQEEEFTFWGAFTRFVKKERWWWWVLYVVSLSLSVICILWILGVITARVVGQTRKSRGLILLISLFLTVIPIAVIPTSK
jgi:ABC-type sugar transport system permease subunit